MEKKKNLEWLNCSESELAERLHEWVKKNSLSNTVLLLEGEMGAGKSTWVRALLYELCPAARSQGSPTFPLVQEYSGHDVATGAALSIYHVDLYRLKDENELQDSGIEAQIEEPGALACVEWASMFSDFFAYWTSSECKKRKSVIQIKIQLAEDEERRNFLIT